MKNLFTMSFVALIATSCSTYKNSYRLTDVPDTRAKVTQTVVDVEPDFSKRIKGESLERRRSVTEAKNNAYYNAIVTNNVDVLVDPIYEIKSTKGLFGTRHRAWVTGFAGSYKNARTINVENQNTYTQNLDNFKKFVAIDPIVKEDYKSVYILNNNSAGGCSGSNGSSVVEKEIRTTSDLVTRFNSFLSGKNASSSAEEFKEANIEEPKKKGFLGNLFGKLFGKK